MLIGDLALGRSAESVGGFVRLILVFILGSVLVRTIAERAHIALDPVSVIAGLAIAAFVGFVNLGWEWWVGAITRPFRRQAVVHTTAQTPWQINREASCAVVQGTCFILCAGCAIGLWFVFYSGFDIPKFLQVLFSAIAQEFGISR